MAATAVDTAYLAGFCAVPQPTVQTLIDNPTTDLVTSFLHSLIVKAQECDTVRSERLRLDVELENAIRSGESRVKVSKANADKAHREAETLGKKLQDEGSSMH